MFLNIEVAPLEMNWHSGKHLQISVIVHAVQYFAGANVTLQFFHLFFFQSEMIQQNRESKSRVYQSLNTDLILSCVNIKSPLLCKNNARNEEICKNSMLEFNIEPPSRGESTIKVESSSVQEHVMTGQGGMDSN